MPDRSPTARTARLLAAASIALSCGLLGCIPGWRPGGSQTSMDAFTYESTTDFAQTVRLMDLRTNAVIWSMEVPVGKQVVIRFYADHDLKNTRSPDLMRWEVMERGTEFGELHSSMPVPASIHRRLDVEHRKDPVAVPKPEAPEAAPRPQ